VVTTAVSPTEDNNNPGGTYTYIDGFVEHPKRDANRVIALGTVTSLGQATMGMQMLSLSSMLLGGLVVEDI
jgi:hypothetical protein